MPPDFLDTVLEAGSDEAPESQAKYVYWLPIVAHAVAAFLKCGDLQEGFARVRCPDCKHEMFVSFSCKQRCTCPSCHQKRTLLTSLHVAEEVCSPAAQLPPISLTIPKNGRDVCVQRRPWPPLHTHPLNDGFS
jgi:ribosomal protein S27E